MKKVTTILSILGLALLAGASVSSAATCTAELSKLASGGVLVQGTTDSSKAVAMVIADDLGSSLQVVPLRRGLGAAEVAFDPSLAGLEALFVDSKGRALCVDDLPALETGGGVKVP